MFIVVIKIARIVSLLVCEALAYILFSSVFCFTYRPFLFFIGHFEFCRPFWILSAFWILFGKWWLMKINLTLWVQISLLFYLRRTVPDIFYFQII